MKKQLLLTFVTLQACLAISFSAKAEAETCLISLPNNSTFKRSPEATKKVATLLSLKNYTVVPDDFKGNHVVLYVGAEDEYFDTLFDYFWFWAVDAKYRMINSETTELYHSGTETNYHLDQSDSTETRIKRFIKAEINAVMSVPKCFDLVLQKNTY